MKVEIEVDDRMIPFFEAQAASLKITLPELLAAKIMWQNHDRVEKYNGATGGIPIAPSEAEVAARDAEKAKETPSTD